MARPDRGVAAPEADFSETAVEGRGGSLFCVEPAAVAIVSKVKIGKDILETWCVLRTGCSCLKVHGVSGWLVLGPDKHKAEGFHVELYWSCLPDFVPGYSARRVQVIRIDGHGPVIPAAILGLSGGGCFFSF